VSYVVNDVSLMTRRIESDFMRKQQFPAIAAKIDRDLRAVCQILRWSVEAEIARGRVST